ncbi:uncharacterized protein LOC129327834 [Eublepharis macularius]|uniref:Uncharacterized protein LOC129327834 n=1 Tax=Eublepharis macularius TaxID=481883 RepID=A0AA97KVX1_EUBMA|nr:uncharacterized protein LOC129327834 [Eublepharis macularius]
MAWSRLHIDFAGPFQGHTFLVIVDSYSKWLEVVPVSAMTSGIVIRALQRLITTLGLPDIIVSDNAAQFTSREFQMFLDNNVIWHITSAPFHPSTNGQAQRTVRSAKDSLRKLSHRDFSQRLTELLLWQHTPHTTTGRSLAELLMGRRNYGSGPVWFLATVTRTTGPVSYKVADSAGKAYRRHIDQLRQQWPPREQEQDRDLPPCSTEVRAETDVTAENHRDGPLEGRDCLPAASGIPGTAKTNPSIPAVEPAKDVGGPVEGNPSTEGLRRSQRVRQLPAFLGDYVWSGAPQS